MKLRVREANPADLDDATAYYGPETGDLSAAACAVGWPLSDPNDIDSAKSRAEWSCKQQRDLVENDPTVRFVKVVDEDNNDDIIAVGRWHRYPSGYQHVADLEAVGLKNRDDPVTWPNGFHKDFYLGFLDDLFAARRSWMGEGHYWVLTNIKTREPLQKKGAGSLIIQWGLTKAADENVPAYLEAVVQAMHLYETHGFREVDRQKVDCTAYGMPGVVFELARMRADPK